MIIQKQVYTSFRLISSTRTSIAISNEEKTYRIKQQYQYVITLGPEKSPITCQKIQNITCKALKIKLRIGCDGNEAAGISEKQPARTYMQR